MLTALTSCRKSTAALPVLVGAGFALGIVLFSSTVAGAGSKPTLHEIRVERVPAPILSLDVAQASGLAVAALSDGRVRVWHLDTGEILHEFGFKEPETDQRQKDEGEVEPIRVRFAPGGEILGVSYLSLIHLYDLRNWSELKTIGVEGEDVMRPLPQPQLSQRPLVEKRPDDINTGTRKWVQRKMLGDGRTRITDFAFTMDGTAIVASYCRISCYDKPGGTRWTISSGHEPVRMWELATARMLWEHYSDANRITQRVVPSPDGRRFVEVVFQPGHWLLQVKDLPLGRESYSITLSPFPHEAPDVAFTSDGQHFMSLWSEQHKAWQTASYDSSNGRILDEFIDRAGSSRLALSPDNLLLAATTWRGFAFKLWDMGKRKVVLTKAPRLLGLNIPTLDSIFVVANGHKIVASDRMKGFVFTYELTD